MEEITSNSDVHSTLQKLSGVFSSSMRPNTLHTGAGSTDVSFHDKLSPSLSFLFEHCKKEASIR
jgi:hypothetical protein